jgi:penicillin-binding protein 2
MKRIFKGKNKSKGVEIEPDEIFLDSTNLPDFDRNQFEGRIEKPISKKTFAAAGIVFALIGAVFALKVWSLQIYEGKIYAARSEDNRLHHSIIFADRGVIYDRNGTELAWNEEDKEEIFSRRMYADMEGLSHVLGYIGAPLRDSAGIYYREEFEGKDGAEKFFESELGGENGLKIVETDALLNVQSESVIRPPVKGRNITLSIDARVQNALFRLVEDTARNRGFSGGGAVLMDVKSGEILALTSHPEYSSAILSDGSRTALIEGYAEDGRKPYLNRVIYGLYTPGSTIKPVIAIGALEEGIIAPDKQILSTGSISIPHPYIKEMFSVFSDWKAHGLVDMRRALAVSSNVYFYEVGGGYEEQKGLGIEKIEKYARLFGYGEESGIYGELSESIEPAGTIPSPRWKIENFEDGVWRLGDTYNTAIGQYGFQVTPIQVVRAVSAIANGGALLTPTLLLGEEVHSKKINAKSGHFQVVKEGMRLAVTEGISQMLHFPEIAIAAKSGTAELGASKEFVNSWISGFFPYENPRFAFAVIMERGPYGNLIGASRVVEELFKWMIVNTPEYLN